MEDLILGHDDKEFKPGHEHGECVSHSAIKHNALDGIEPGNMIECCCGRRWLFVAYSEADPDEMIFCYNYHGCTVTVRKSKAQMEFMKATEAAVAPILRWWRSITTPQPEPEEDEDEFVTLHRETAIEDIADMMSKGERNVAIVVGSVALIAGILIGRRTRRS